MDAIKIRGLSIEGRHGVLEKEKTHAQKFEIDADIGLDLYRAGTTDALEDTINYAEVCAVIEGVVKGNCFDLIEKLAYECAFALTERYKTIKSLSLTVFKPCAPLDCTVKNVGVTVNIERETVYLSLGSSLGDRKATLDSMLTMLGKQRGIEVLKVSDYIETEPYGGVAQHKFLNCAAQISTVLSPHALLDCIHVIESSLGRQRTERWGDRTADIDIIFFGDKVVCDERLTIPHPEWKKRDFVKIPLKNIAPHLLQKEN